MQTQVLNSFNDIPKRCHLALDTCVFLDAYKNREKFRDFFILLKEKKITLTTTYLVYLEFSRGFDTLKEFNEAAEWFDKTIDLIYPVKGLEEWIEKLKLVYRKYGRDVGPTDFSLGALLLKHKEKIYLLSKNHKHFITDLFDIQAFLPLLRTNEVQTYCFYKYSEEKYVIRLKNLEKTI